MIKAAIIKNNKVENTLIFDDNEQGRKDIENMSAIIVNPEVSVGWSYDGYEFTPPPLTPEQVELLNAQEQRKADLESARLKLEALGLNDQEIAAILGQ